VYFAGSNSGSASIATNRFGPARSGDSSRLDPLLKATNAYVVPLDGTTTVPPVRRVSSAVDVSVQAPPVRYYYGDYSGLDVVGGHPYPVWISKGADKDVHTWVP
jgi:hypothetical protein